jgi:hypothetical protein
MVGWPFRPRQRVISRQATSIESMPFEGDSPDLLQDCAYRPSAPMLRGLVLRGDT